MNDTKANLDDIVSSSAESIVQYWDSFYRMAAMRTPSQFAALVASELKSPHIIIDVGCGNGRDTFFFGDIGHIVIGLDASGTAIDSNSSQISDDLKERIFFRQFTVGEDSFDAVTDFIAGAQFDHLPVVIYSRFFLHAITSVAEDEFAQQLSGISPTISGIFLEYRDIRDANMVKIYADHYRRFIDPDAFSKKLTSDSDYSLLYQVIGQGFAKYGREDPWIARQIFAARSNMKADQ